MRKAEITLDDKLDFLANAHFYEPFLNGENNKGPRFVKIGFFAMAVTTGILSVVVSPAFAIASIGCLWVDYALIKDDIKTQKEIVKYASDGKISYREYKKLKRTGELNSLKSLYKEEIKTRIRFGILNGNLAIFKDKKRNKIALEENCETAVSKVFGEPYTNKTQKQEQVDKDLERQFASVFGESEYQKRNKNHSNDRQM